MKKEEKWRRIEGYEDLYEVSNFGNVRSLNYLHTGHVRLLKLQTGKDGYLQVLLYKDGNVKCFLVHRLVWEAFVGKIQEGLQVNHIDENKENNFVFVNPDGSVDLQKSNLNLMTPKDNVNWGTHNQRMVESKSKPVVQLTLDGKFVKLWPSTQECGRNGFDYSAVAKCCRGEIKQYKGYIWQYADDFLNSLPII